MHLGEALQMRTACVCVMLLKSTQNIWLGKARENYQGIIPNTLPLEDPEKLNWGICYEYFNMYSCPKHVFVKK